MKYYKKNEAYLQGQLGNPEGEGKPNKDKYDPRKWVRESEVRRQPCQLLQPLDPRGS